MPNYYQEIEILEAAIERLETKGWQRGHMGLPDGPNCLMGALIWTARSMRAPGRHHRLYKIFDAWHAVMGYSLPLSRWNDKVCPDAATAADSLRLTAKHLAEISIPSMPAQGGNAP